MCYKFVGQHKYKEAEQKCNDLGAQLAIPRSDNEFDDFYAILSALGLSRTVINFYVDLVLGAF